MLKAHKVSEQLIVSENDWTIPIPLVLQLKFTHSCTFHLENSLNCIKNFLLTHPMFSYFYFFTVNNSKFAVIN